MEVLHGKRNMECVVMNSTFHVQLWDSWPVLFWASPVLSNLSFLNGQLKKVIKPFSLTCFEHELKYHIWKHPTRFLVLAHTHQVVWASRTLSRSILIRGGEFGTLGELSLIFHSRWITTFLPFFLIHNNYNCVFYSCDLCFFQPLSLVSFSSLTNVLSNLSSRKQGTVTVTSTSEFSGSPPITPQFCPLPGGPLFIGKQCAQSAMWPFLHIPEIGVLFLIYYQLKCLLSWC